MISLKRSKVFVNHHITNRRYGGKNTKSNLIRLEENREKAWHFLFHNLSFEEVAELLTRTCQMKGRN